MISYKCLGVSNSSLTISTTFLEDLEGIFSLTKFFRVCLAGLVAELVVRALVVAVAAAAARAAEPKGGGGAHITPPPDNEALAAAAPVVLVAHRAQGAGVAALTRAVEGACAQYKFSSEMGVEHS